MVQLEKCKPKKRPTMMVNAFAGLLLLKKKSLAVKIDKKPALKPPKKRRQTILNEIVH